MDQVLPTLVDFAAILFLAIIGIFVKSWQTRQANKINDDLEKHQKLLAEAVRQQQEEAAQASSWRCDLDNRIKTNHGSKSTGDALDRQTDLLLDIQGSIVKHEQTLDSLKTGVKMCVDGVTEVKRRMDRLEDRSTIDHEDYLSRFGKLEGKKE